MWFFCEIFVMWSSCVKNRGPKIGVQRLGSRDGVLIWGSKNWCPKNQGPKNWGPKIGVPKFGVQKLGSKIGVKNWGTKIGVQSLVFVSWPNFCRKCETICLMTIFWQEKQKNLLPDRFFADRAKNLVNDQFLAEKAKFWSFDENFAEKAKIKKPHGQGLNSSIEKCPSHDLTIKKIKVHGPLRTLANNLSKKYRKRSPNLITS